MINFNKNKLINITLSKYYETFSYTLDTEDFVEPKINKMITRYICKNLKRHFKKIDKEDKKYQKIFNKKQKDKEKMRKNQEEKPKKQKKWLNFFKNLFKKGQRTAKCADSNNNS